MDYKTLITSQHKNKPKFAALVDLFANAFAELADVARSIPRAYDLDVAIGMQLNVVGEWIGQSRVIPGVLTLGYFGFSDNVAAANFGEEGNASIGGRFFEETEPFTSTAVLFDPEYRTILRAKIVRNQYQGTTQEIINSLQTIFGTSAHVTDTGTMNLIVTINAPLSTVFQSLLTNFDILPRPAGVAIGSIIYTDLSGHAFDVASSSASLTP